MLWFMHALLNRFPVFHGIKVHWKRTLNRSLDTEFNALRENVVGIEKIEFQTTVQSERQMSFSIYGCCCRCFSSF